MRAKTKLLLCKLLWMEEFLGGRPSVVSLVSGLSGWENRTGMARTLQRLERDAFLESEGRSLDRVVKLTKKGRQLFQGERDPEKQWERAWDGKWRMVVFDIPESSRKLREDLRNLIKAQSFGCLQKSIWISPDPFGKDIRNLRRMAPAPRTLSFLECSELYGGKPMEIAKAAWDFASLESSYTQYLSFLDYHQETSGQCPLEEFLAQENHLWDQAMGADPLLPNELLPKKYLGKDALKARREIVPKIVETLIKCDIISDDR